MSGSEQAPAPSGTGRLLTGVAWVVLLLGLWLWGGPPPNGAPAGPAGPATGDMAAAGRPSPAPSATVPRRLDIPALGVRVPVTARDLDEHGALAPPPPGTVAWYADGAAPGAPGTALMAGRIGDAGARPAVGQEIRVVGADGEAAGFTVRDVRVVARDRFDVRQAHAPRDDGRAELRLITCGRTAACGDRVVVTAYPAGG